ncbi:MAG: EAL domain-containing protein [Gammaproteobacteria bacterium]|nr:EAL domain-containing protein [Gammaproteobacteria bacterium]
MTKDSSNAPPLVLIVDDDISQRLLVSEALEIAGFAVEEADNGKAALAAFQRLRPDLVLLDVMMPGMDGYQVCEVLRELPCGRHISVLMMTGLEDIDSINRAYEVGATDFVTKPINYALLGHRLRYMLRSQQSEEKVRRLAYFDTLTGLPNRESFKERLGKAVANARRHKRHLATLFLDIDDFKRINDTLGHNVGDQLLKAVGKRLKESIRGSDVIGQEYTGDPDENEKVARLGGDEFTVVLTEIHQPEDAALVAERIIAILSQPLILHGHDVFITPSIGIALFPQDAQDAESLIKQADMAMYYSKRQGKHQYQFFNKEMNTAAIRRMRLESCLRKALNQAELSLHYQPQIDLIGGQIRGIEALLRWHNPLLGSISPSEFIPLAEETGLIIPIGEWVLQSVCTQAQAWRSSGLPVPRMAVNISVIQFVQPGFVDLVERTLQETGLESNVLELEITEGLLMKDAEGAIRTLTALKALGVQLAIDDFGTGYSSLSYLKQFPIDRLKIDRAFVREVNSDPDDAAIATAVIAMADSMDLGVVAEGVETKAQLKFLQSKYCNEMQGYYLSKPLPVGDMEAFLQEPSQCVSTILEETVSQSTILLVDDDANTLNALNRLITPEGYHILNATCAQEGFDLLAKHDVAVVMADYKMPEMDGIEFLKNVSKLFPSVIRMMVSGESDLKSIIKTVNEGAIYKFLEKPVTGEVLRDTLRQAFLRHEQSIYAELVQAKGHESSKAS